MLSDHFIEEKLNDALWQFCNMTSPSTVLPRRIGDSVLALPEHDMWNEGNCLLSRNFLSSESMVTGSFLGWDKEGTGCAVGFYGGVGSFEKYVLLAATDTHVEFRVHSGAQNGEAFMSKGQPKWLVPASVRWDKHFPIRLTLYRKGHHYRACIDGVLCMEADIPEIDGDARAIVKALPWGNRFEPCYAYLDELSIDGLAPVCMVCGSVVGEDGRAIAGAGVHIAGFDRYVTLTDGNGNFSLAELPSGRHVLVAAAEGYLFAKKEIFCVSEKENSVVIRLLPQTENNLPRKEYNRPLFDRSGQGWSSLNGIWQFCFDPDNTGIEKHFYETNAPQYERHIRVPFSWTSLMGFGEEFLASGHRLRESNSQFNNYHITGEYAWYRRCFTVPESFPKEENVILHIGACANVTWLWLDGAYFGVRTEEYSDLEFDLGRLVPGTQHTLVIRVQYPHDIVSHNLGKQIFWFSASPGIWQSVWIEHRKSMYLTKVQLTPELCFENGRCVEAAFAVDVAAQLKGANGTVCLRLRAPESGRFFESEIRLMDGRGQCRVEIKEPELWEYRHGRCYRAEFILMAENTEQDRVLSYAGLRKIETRWLPGHSPCDTEDIGEQYQYIYLNDRPFYVIGVLDQGYNAFGVYTYRSLGEEGKEGKRGSICYDIDRTLAYGYNLSRLHIKENEPLWYAECDRRGLPVWAEHPGNFYATPEDPRWQQAYDRELTGMLERLHNHPSIVIFSAINESWGVEGCHCSTPWENELRYLFIRNNAQKARELAPQMLICDNSGFGKTGAGDINDFHNYPAEWETAKECWKSLLKDCYPGSHYNHINQENGVHAVGEAEQTGKPILISEFLHVNGIDMQIRQFEKIAGYLRMNVASHETEDSGPLTAERYQRDYGYVDHHMSPLGYDMVNCMDMVIPDRNRIEHVKAGETIEIGLYLSHFSYKETISPTLHVTVTGIDRWGRYVEHLAEESRAVPFIRYAVRKQTPFVFRVPEHIRGAYVFFYVEDQGRILCRNYIQLCVDPIAHALPFSEENEITISPASFLYGEGDYLHVFEEGDGRCAVGISGRGVLRYAILLQKEARKAVLLMEVGAREGKNAVRVTDEQRHPSKIEFFWDGRLVEILTVEDDASDERGLFSNAAQGGKPFDYTKTGRLGYGERVEISLPPEGLTAGEHVMELRCGSGGMTLYGEYTGRCGMDPTVIIE